MTLAALLAAAPAGAAAGNATVTVVHGIPATPVDVYANGSKLLSDFKTVTQPLSVPAGSYTIDVRKAGAAPASAPILSATEKVPAGANVTLVADLSAAGNPRARAVRQRHHSGRLREGAAGGPAHRGGTRRGRLCGLI